MADDDTSAQEVERRFPSTGDLGRAPESVINYSDYVKAQASTYPEDKPPPQDNQPSPTRQAQPRYTGPIPPPPFQQAPPFNPPQVPSPAQYGLGPREQYSAPFEVFKNPIVVLATLGSLFTRTPLISAMNAATGAMNGYTKGQEDQYELNKVKFNSALQMATEQNRIELEKYNAAWDRTKIENWNKSLPALWGEAVQNNDQIMMQALRMGPEYAEKIMSARASAQAHAQSAFDSEQAREQAKEQEVERLKQDPGVIAQAKAISRYEQPNVPVSRVNPRNQAIQELVTQFGEESGVPYEPSGYGAKNKFVTGLGATTPGSPGGQVNSAKIVIHHLATLDRIIDDLGTESNSMTFRRAAQTLQTQFGLSAAPTDFDAAVSLISGEIVKLVEGSGGTGEDRAHVQSAFDRAKSAPLLHSAVDVAREVMSARVKTLSEQAKGLHAEGQFNRLLPPDIAKELEPRGAGKARDPDEFRRDAKAHGYTDKEIDDFLAKQAH